MSEFIPEHLQFWRKAKQQHHDDIEAILKTGKTVCIICQSFIYESDYDKLKAKYPNLTTKVLKGWGGHKADFISIDEEGRA